MDTAGAFAFGGALHGPDVASVVSSGMDKVMTDGPFVEAKEHIAGFYIVNAESLDDALRDADSIRLGPGRARMVRAPIPPGWRPSSMPPTTRSSMSPCSGTSVVI